MASPDHLKEQWAMALSISSGLLPSMTHLTASLSMAFKHTADDESGIINGLADLLAQSL